MDAKIILGEVTPAASDLIDLRVVTRSAFDAGAYAAAIRFDTDQFHRDPVVCSGPLAMQERGSGVHVVDEDVDGAIVIEVTERDTSAGGWLSYRGSCG